jgi:CHASE1-domain containing sensor protein
MQQSEAELIAWLPLVNAKQRATFEQYAARNQAWTEDGLRLKGKEPASPTISREIVPLPGSNLTATEFESQDYYVPLWQSSPASLTASRALGDLRTHPKLRYLFDEVMETKHPVLSDVIDVSFLLEESLSFEPRSIILEPVFAKFSETKLDRSTEQVVGFIAAVMPWRVYFADELPSGTGAILVEMSNTCGARFSCST